MRHHAPCEKLCEGAKAATPVWMLPRRCTVPMPLYTRPKMVCLPSSQGVGASVRKNCIKKQWFHEPVSSQLIENVSALGQGCRCMGRYSRSLCFTMQYNSCYGGYLGPVGVGAGVGHGKDAYAQSTAKCALQ